MNNNKLPDVDFNIEEVEQVVAPDVDVDIDATISTDGTKILPDAESTSAYTTSIVSVCRCS
jgi:hypothetical protein